jgi:integrase
VKGDRNTSGVDIVAEKRAARVQKQAEAVAAAAPPAPTFRECAQAYIDEMWLRWSEKHRNQWPSSLKTYAYPTIGNLTIAEIRPSHVQKLLTPIWLSKRETANRVRGRIETIIAANVEVDDPAPNPAALTKVLREALPKRPKRVVQHHAALPYEEMPQFMAALSAAPGRAAAMLRFLIFTACRTNEIVAGAWAEIDRPETIWRSPASA